MKNFNENRLRTLIAKTRITNSEFLFSLRPDLPMFSSQSTTFQKLQYCSHITHNHAKHVTNWNATLMSSTSLHFTNLILNLSYPNQSSQKAPEETSRCIIKLKLNMGFPLFRWAPPPYVTLGFVGVFVCLCVIEKNWFRGYSNKFPRRNGCRGLKFCLHIKIGVTRWQMVKMSFGVPPPQKKLFGGRTQICCQKWKKSKLFKIAWNGEKISWKRVLDF